MRVFYHSAFGVFRKFCAIMNTPCLLSCGFFLPSCFVTRFVYLFWTCFYNFGSACASRFVYLLDLPSKNITVPHVLLCATWASFPRILRLVTQAEGAES